MNIAAHHSMADSITFSGTSFLLKTNTNTRVLSINSLVKDSSSSSITIDWGDRTSNVYTTNVSSVSHTYPGDDFYLLRISDDVSSINFQSGYWGNSRLVIACFLSLGLKITTISGYCFKNYMIDLDSGHSTWCGLSVQQYVDVLVQRTFNSDFVVNATTIGGYSFFPYCMNVRFAKATSISAGMFDPNGLKYVKKLAFDAVDSIGASNAFSGSSQFTDNSATNYDYKSVTFTNKTVSQIRSMDNYPWGLSTATFPIYIHGTDGTINSGSLS